MYFTRTVRMLMGICCFVVFDTEATRLTPEDATIVSGALWKDDAGRDVHAHGAGMILPKEHPAGKDGKYFMVGTTEKHDPNWLSEGINVYSSYDLEHWHFENEIFRNESIDTPLSDGTSYRIERPKILFNEKTKTYVLWFHLDSERFGMGMVGVATCDEVAGNYTYIAGWQPDGQRSLDMTLFRDKDGSAYLVRSVDNQYAGFSQLTDDYLNTTTDGIISRGPRLEGQAVWRDGDAYYLLGSHLTGWSANPAILASTKGPLRGAEWSVLGNPSDSDTTFNSQSTYALPYRHPKTNRTLVIYMGDRWNAGHAPNPYVWLPMIKNESSGSYTIPAIGDKNDDGAWRIADY